MREDTGNEGFVVLDTDDRLRDLKPLHDLEDTIDNIIRVLADLTVVGRDVRLALRGIDDQGIRHLILRRIELDICRESGAAQSDQTGVADHLDKVFE